MDHPTSILKSPIPLIILLGFFPNVISQNSQCPFTSGVQPIVLEGYDTDDGTIPLFSEETDLVVVGARIGSDPDNPIRPLGPLLVASFSSTPDRNVVSIFAKYPDFGVEVDYYGFSESASDGSKDALQIDVEGANGVETRYCFLRLTIHDTNNLEPHFNTSNDKRDFEFIITTAWDKKNVALNWKADDLIYVTDWDRTEVLPTLEIVPNEVNITAVLTKVEMTGGLEFANVWRVDLFVYGDLLENEYGFTITPSDGDNTGGSLNFVLKVEEQDLFKPVFTSKLYYKQLDTMPTNGDPLLDVKPECYDPDDLLNGRSTVFEYSLKSDDDITEYLDFEPDTNNLKFIKNVTKAFMGKTVSATITATKVGTTDSLTSQLTLAFPPLPKKIEFDTPIHVVHLSSWPEANNRDDDILVPEATGELTIFYELGTSRPPPTGLIFLGKDADDKDVIQFTKDVEPDMLGDLEDNRVMIFDIVVKYPELRGHPELDDVITIVLTFPPRNDDTTEYTTTVQECETCQPCSTTGTTDLTTECSCGSTDITEVTCPTTECSCGTTEITEITCPTELPTTPCDCEGTTPPDMTTPECPPPTTCEPSVTGNPTTEIATECPVCGTTEASDVTCGTSSVDPTTGGTSGGPCDCSTEVTCPTLEPCEGSSSEVPGSTPTPCDCDSSPTTCPTVEPCESSDEDCSTTGLVVAVIATSILCVCSIAAGGYCLWLLRKATLDPTKLARDSLLRPDVSTPPPTDVETNVSDYTTPNRFSFGDGINEYSSGSRFAVPTSSGPGVEPGFANPNFTNDMGVNDTTPVNPQPETKQRRKSSIKPPKDIEPDYEESPKKSNMKAPKEIEPDYEEVVSPQEPDYEEVVSPPEPVQDSGKQSRVLFAPEDEYISVDGGSNVVGDEGGDGGSDVEDERL